MWYHGNKAVKKRGTLSSVQAAQKSCGRQRRSESRLSRLSSRCPDSDSNELETFYRFWAISCSNKQNIISIKGEKGPRMAFKGSLGVRVTLEEEESSSEA